MKTLVHSVMLGCCALAPVVQVDDDVHSRMTAIRLKQVLEGYD